MTVRFYTRAGCHLCEQALAVLMRTQERIPFEIETIDVDREAGAREKYGLDVPVVLFADGTRFEHRLHPARFAQAVSKVLEGKNA